MNRYRVTYRGMQKLVTAANVREALSKSWELFDGPGDDHSISCRYVGPVEQHCPTCNHVWDGRPCGQCSGRGDVSCTVCLGTGRDYSR